MRKNQKGFTLVELLVVIAIIAILATVCVVGYVSFIDKANQSVDEQAVAQINKALEALEATDGKFTDVAQVIKALGGMDLDVEDYKPLKSGMYFYWDAGLNRVVYADANDKIVYPEDTEKKGQWMSLSGLVPMDSNYNIENSVATITSGAQLAHLLNNLRDDITTIKLSGEIDMRGAALGFDTAASELTLDGGDKNTTVLKGLRVDTNAFEGTWAGQEKSFGYALFGDVESGKSVTVKNITISGAIIQKTDATDKAFGMSAVLFGAVRGEVTIEDVTIENSKVIGGDKVGSLIGYLTGKATIKDVTVKNTELYGLGGIAPAIGVVAENAVNNLTLENVDCTGVVCGINKAQWKAIWWDTDINWATGESVKVEDVKSYVTGSENTYVPYDQNNTHKLAAMCTKDLYWIDNGVAVGNDNKAEDGTLTIKDEYKQIVNGIAGGFKISSNDGGKVS